MNVCLRSPIVIGDLYWKAAQICVFKGVSIKDCMSEENFCVGPFFVQVDHKDLPIRNRACTEWIVIDKR